MIKLSNIVLSGVSACALIGGGFALSAAAARRLGFSYEGCFRQHMISKAQSRDTLWFSMLDSEWEEKKAHFERVLYSGEGVSLSMLNG